VNFATAPGLEWQQNLTETAGRSLSMNLAHNTMLWAASGRAVDENA
jgi:hypothetical protein